ncbi:MAG: hypothetical protein R8K47_01060, partial [Mariprofundaceae bacterium]
SHVSGLVRAWFEGLRLLRDQPDEAYRRLAPRLRLPPEGVAAAFNGLILADLRDNRRMLAEEAAAFLQNARAMQRALQRAGLVRAPFTAAGLIDASFMPGPAR